MSLKEELRKEFIAAENQEFIAAENQEMIAAKALVEAIRSGRSLDDDDLYELCQDYIVARDRLFPPEDPLVR
jgi:hypothetical protein